MAAGLALPHTNYERRHFGQRQFPVKAKAGQDPTGQG